MNSFENDYAKTVVATVMGKPVTQGELSKAFDVVANKANWKMPIDCDVTLKSHREMAMISKAVVFFTGSVAKFTAVALLGSKCRYRVTAAGYYATIGA